MNFLLDLPLWLWLVYLVPMAICLATAIVAIIDDGYLTLGEAIEIALKTFIPVVNIVMLLLIAKELMPSRYTCIWQRKTPGGRSWQ